jgi:hypothetical protein
MATIMIHHMAIISVQIGGPQIRGSAPMAIALMSMPGMSAVCWCGKSASLDISHAFMPSPAPATI